MPWPLYHALKQLFPTGKRFPFFTFMSGLGIAVGVALMLVSSSIMGGFGHEIRSMIVDSEGEVQVLGRQGAVPDPEQAMEEIRSVPAVVGATPTVSGVVMLMNRNHPAYPVLRGIDLQTEPDVLDLERFLLIGSLEELDDDSIILSRQLARSIGATLDSEVEIYSPLIFERLHADEVYLPQVLRVAGIFEIGHPELDGNMAICTLRRMQDLYGIGDAVHRINVRLEPGVDEFRAARQINEILSPGTYAITWVEAWGDFQSIIRFEKYMVFFLLAFIVVVAALSIMSSLLISVVRKTREIGLLGALGARPRDVALSYCFQGLLLGAVGTAAGLIIGALVLYYRNALMRLIASVAASEEAFQAIYGFVDLPMHVAPGDVAAMIVGSIICSVLAGLVPAWRAAKLKPAEALRSE